MSKFQSLKSVVALAIALTWFAPRLQVPLIAAETNSEQQLIQVLQSDRSAMEKSAACAQLKRIGTVGSVPALSSLLSDEQLSHSARYALESMPWPEAGRALLAALDKSSGLTKAGIIASLGIRGETKAVPALAKLLGDSDAAVAAAAATALGQIADPAAIKALESALNSATGPVRDAIVDSCLRCANRLWASGSDTKALELYQRLYDDTQNKDSVRVAAYRGILLSPGKRLLTLMTEAIAGPAGPSQTAALGFVHETDLPDATKSFAQLLSQVGPPVQLALIEGLSQRGDPLAAPAIAELVKSTEPQVSLAAISALGVLGNESNVALLVETAASASGAEQAAAREALLWLRRGPITKALLNQLAAAKPAVRAESARALGGRADAAAIPSLLELARQSSGPASEAAVQALSLLVDQQQLASLVQLVVETKNETARAQAADALNSACQHIQSKHGRLEVEPLIKGLGASSAEARIALLPICVAFNDPRVRTALRAAVTDADQQVRAAAIRALCETTDAELLLELLKLACGAPEENFRTLAVGACVRLTTQEETVKLPDSRKIETMKAILAAGPNDAQKRLVLSGLAEIADAEALQLAQPLLDDASVQSEAARAVMKIASAFPGDAAAAALKRVIAVAPDAATRQEAETALKRFASGSAYITTWQAAGPYRQEGKNYAALFDIAFAPETTDAQNANWKPLPSGSDPKRPWMMDLRKALGGEECVAYARTWIRCAQRQPAQLVLGSDDGIKVWLNNELVHADNVARALKPGSDKVNVTLKAGWNLLLLKITQHTQGWAFCARLLKPDGSPLEGLQFDAAPHLSQL